MAFVADAGSKSPGERPKRRRKTPRERAEETAAADPATQRTVGMNAALRLLSLRGRSEHELKLALTRRGIRPEVSEEVLTRLRGFGYLDDAKFAKDRAASLLRGGRLGARAVLQRLRNHGLTDPEAKRALARAEAELGFDPQAAARQVLERRGWYGRELTLKEKSRAWRLLQGRGFSSEVISRLMGGAPSAPEDD